ncbi:MAG TPA: MdtA/MuxA family multidrug efflux RND transporter periplasmic adaptor subunit [Bryobacteraceae bacterium]|nr:MdtA/MuxA family multidrug efflux RND transporter periplasmic adaptor subunit [Bryobacteraceae bacterium]
MWLLILVVAAGAAVWLFQSRQTHAQAPGGAAGRAARSMMVPVAVAPAVRGDIPVYLEGLGSVTPFYTVSVHTRVDGQLMNVFFKEGQFVNVGDTLVEIDPRPFQVMLEQAEGQMAHDQALLANANVDLTRYKTLLAQDAIPEQQLATQGATVKQYDGAIKTDQGVIDNAKLQIAYCHLTAPISGRIGLRLVDPGNIVHASDANPLLVITQMQPITVIFTLPEDSLPPVLQKLRAGAKLTVDAYNRDKSRKLASGTLLTTDNQIDQTTGTLKLRAVFENKDSMLFPQQFVNVRLLVELKKQQVIVPSVAIQRGSQGTYVYAVNPDSTAAVKVITTGISEAGNTSVESGLEAGQNVVIDGADKLQPGTKVTVRTPTGAPVGPGGNRPAGGGGGGSRRPAGGPQA